VRGETGVHEAPNGSTGREPGQPSGGVQGERED
jgi:hypothetical protein